MCYVTGHGAEQPVAPGHGLVVEAAAHERLQGQGGVAQPAVAVVPVAAAPDGLGQRRRRRGHDAPRRLVGQRFQGDERADHGVTVGTLVGAAGTPFLPVGVRQVDGVKGVERSGWILVRGEPHQGEGEALALLHREVGQRVQVAADGLDHVPQGHRLGAGGHADEAVVRREPRNDLAVVEAHGQIHVHVDRSRHPFDQADHVGMGVTHGHAVGDAHRPGGGVELGLEHQGVLAVATPCGHHGRLAPGGIQLPEAVRLVAEQPGEARRGVEMGQAEPVDGPVLPHDGSRVQIADHGVVL